MATIGPKSCSEKSIKKILRYTNLFRLNGSHNTLDWHVKISKKIKAICPESFILFDIPGLKPRTNNNEIVDIGFRIRDAINVYYNTKGQEDPTSNFQWEFVLVDDDQTKNAWCMPGGKIAFYSGILPIAKNKDGIASIMGHEIAHAVARHSAERASTAMLTDFGIMALEKFVLGQRLPQASGYVRQFGLDLPFNRKQESEADYLGIIFSSLAGYNIEESYKVWERMKEEGGSGPAEFWSTHPSPDNRIKKLKEWIPIVSRQYPAIG